MESSGFPSSPTGGKLGLKKQVDQIQYTVDEHSATLAKHSQLLNSSSNDLSSQLTQLEEKMMEAMNAMKDELMKKISSVAADVSQLQKQLNVQKGEQGILTQQNKDTNRKLMELAEKVEELNMVVHGDE